MKTNGVTVNGVVLDEYLKDKETLSETLEREKIIREGNNPVTLKRHIKPRYKEHKEKNGKVRTLNQLEINKEYYEPYLKQAIENKKIDNAFIIVLFYMYDQENLDIHIIADFMYNFSQSRNIEIRPTVRHALRAKLGHIRRSELAKYMYFIDKKDKRNKRNRIMFGIDTEKAKNLSLDEAIKLGNSFSGLRLGTGKPGPVPRKPVQSSLPPTSKQVPLPAEEQKDDPNIAVKNSEVESLTTKVLKEVKALSKEGSFLTIQGDLHIHIHIDRS